MRRFPFFIMICIFWLLNSPVFANKIVELSKPTPRIHGQIAVGDSHTYTYQIKNNAPGQRFKIEVRGLKHYMKRTTVQNDCGSALSLGPSTCNIGITVIPTNSEAGKWIHEELEIYYQGGTPLRAFVEFQVPSLPIYASVGVNGDNNTPLIVTSNDSTGKGQTWSVQSPQDYPGILKASSCVGSYPNTVCMAVGSRDMNSALILISRSGGDWYQPSYEPVNVPLTDVVCRGDGSNAFCIAISTSPDFPAKAYATTDVGEHWSLINNIPSGLILTGLGCSGNYGDSICAIIDKSGQVFIGQQKDRTWKNINLNDKLSSVSCLGGSETGICVITSTNGAYLINAKSLDTTPTKIILSSNLTLTTSTCIGTPEDPLCVLGGSSVNPTTHLNVPQVYVSNMPGLMDWTNPPIQDYLAGSVEVVNLACTGSGSTATCIAVGNETLLAVSQDGGQTWKQKAETLHQYLFGASCNYVPGNPPTVTCLATGSSTNLLSNTPNYTGTPNLYVSPDGGSTWYHSPVANSPMKGGYVGIGVTPT